MAKKLPSVRARFSMKQAMLAKQASNVYTQMGSTQGLIYFPTPAVPLATLVGFINTYTTALAAARKGSKTQTEAKNQAKATLIGALRAQALYVTNTAQLYPSDAVPVLNQQQLLRQIILASGFQVNKVPNPVADNIGVKYPIIKKAISTLPGRLHLLLRQYTRFKKGTKTWQLRWRIPASGSTPAGPWINQFFSSGNINADGITSGKIEYQIAAVGGHNTRLNIQNPINWTPIKTIIIT